MGQGQFSNNPDKRTTMRQCQLWKSFRIDAIV
jgi:hypothetical protein